VRKSAGQKQKEVKKPLQVKALAVEDAVGTMVCHDLTRIVSGQFKGPLLRKGHVISPQDIPVLKQAGKNHISVIELEADDVHEDEAGLRLARAAAGPGTSLSGPMEGKVCLLAARKGLLKIDRALLNKINSVPDIAFATIPGNRLVSEGEVLAGTRVIPVAVKRSLIDQAEQVLNTGCLVEVKPLVLRKVGLIVTGDEVHSGLVPDAFAPRLRQKLQAFGATLTDVRFEPDDPQAIAAAIKKRVVQGDEVVLVTGGMSVDPDDATPEGIRLAGCRVVRYGAPVLPGSMFLMSYLKDTPVMGVPACGVYHETTVLDLVLPRVLAGEEISSEDISGLGYGGLCRACVTCEFPRCSFGTG
jgi:hypothetical protein